MGRVVGVNLETFPNWPQDVIRLKHPVILVRHHDPVALASLPQEIFKISRPFGDHDFDWRNRPVQDYINRSKALLAEFPYDAVEGPNEPNPGGDPNTREAEIAKFLAFTRALLDAGLPLAFGAFSSGNFGTTDPNWPVSLILLDGQDVIRRAKLITVHADFGPGRFSDIEELLSKLPTGKIVVATELALDRTIEKDFNIYDGWIGHYSPAQVMDWLKQWNQKAEATGRVWGCWFTLSDQGWGHWQWDGLRPLWEAWASAEAPKYPALKETAMETINISGLQVVADSLPKHPSKAYTTRPYADIKHHIWHHAAGYGSPETIAKYHVEVRQKPGIAYHFYIRRDGTIYQVNWLSTVSWHTGTAEKINNISVSNLYGIATCLEGILTEEPVTEAQKRSLSVVAVGVEVFLNRTLSDSPHNQWEATACPGAWETIKAVLDTDYEALYRQAAAENEALKSKVSQAITILEG